MRLLLIRHGQTPSNVGQHLDTAEPGADLTELGRSQAAAIPRALAHEEIGLIVASTLVRTQQTAEPLARARGMEILVRPGVREVTAGDFEMANDAASIQAYLGTIFGGDPLARMPGGETGAEVAARYDQVIAEAADLVGDGTAAVFSHGAVMRSWAAHAAEGIDIGFARTHWVPNTGMIALQGRPGAWRVDSWGSTTLGETIPA